MKTQCNQKFFKKRLKKKKKSRAGLLSQGRIKGKEFQVQRTIFTARKAAVLQIHREDTRVMSIYAPSDMAATSVKQVLREMKQEPEEPEEGRATQLCVADAAKAS